ncbi:MAG: response regulator transcription factor [Chloroflexota bacterium]
MAAILVVDDDVDVADTIRRSLLNKGHIVQVVYNGVEALEAVRQKKPDLVILDVVMPHMDGMEVCRRLRRDVQTAQIPIIFLTAMGRLTDKLEGYEAGADDYLTKPFDIQEMEVRVRAVLRRSLPTIQAEPDILAIGGLRLNRRTYEVRTDSMASLLTPIEFELLHYLMSHPDEVFSSERLLQEVWEYPPGTGDPALVRMHIKNIRDKIEQNPRRPLYVCTVSRHGYRISTD